MNYLQAIVLGVVQGITEFLPISSSGHLVLVPMFLNWNIPEEQIFPFDVLIQLGTLLAVIIYFRKDLWNILLGVINGVFSKKPFGNPSAVLGWQIVVATIPAVVIGIFLKDIVEQTFKSPLATALFLWGTALLLLLSEQVGKQIKTIQKTTWLDALIIGLFQVLSMFPGISRSGSTIAGGVLRNVKREDAARFSFLMSIPVMFGAGLLSIFDLLNIPDLTTFLPVLITGFIVAAVVGYVSIHWLLKFLIRNSLKSFAIYCFLIGLVAIIFIVVR